MAFEDYQDLYTRVIYSTRRDINDTFDVARAKEAVNEAYLSFCDSGPQWSFLTAQGNKTLTIDDDTYTFSEIASSLSVTAVTDVVSVSFNGAAGSYNAHYAGWDDFWAIKQLNPSLASGTPHLWTTYARSNVQVWPKPATALTATFVVIRRPTALSANTDTTLLPQGWASRIIIPAASAIILRQENSPEAADLARHFDEQYQLAFKAMAETQSMLFTPQVKHPTEAKILLPSGLQGTAGTFLALAQNVCFQSGMRPWNSYELQRAKDAVNEALQAVSFTGDPWNWLEREGEITLQAGSDVYTYSTISSALGVTLSEILSLVMDNQDGGYRLESMSWDALENATYGTQDGEQSGEPIFWADWDSKIRVYPKPDEAYVLGVFYRAYQSLLSADTDTPLMPIEWRTRLLVPYAAARLLEQEGSPTSVQRADRYWSEYQKAFNDCRAACATIHSPAMRLASPSWRDQMWMG